MNDYISKPVDNGRLLDILGKWLPSIPYAGVGAGAGDVSELEAGGEENAPLPLPDLPGIDIHLALERASGNRELMERVIRLFARENRDSARKLEELLGSGEAGEAAALVHGIKGTAGAIAATKTATAALALEQAIHTGAGEWKAPLGELQGQLDTVIRGTALLTEQAAASVPRSQAGQIVSGRVSPLLQALDRYLQDSNMQALACFEELQPLLQGAPEFADPLQQLAVTLERLEFDQAREALGIIADTLAAKHDN